jgi:hypothetical protein
MRRSDINQALVYMRKAYRLDLGNADFRYDYYMALVATSHLDSPAEDGRLLLEVNNVFYNELISKADRDASIEALKERWEILMREPELEVPPLEWSYKTPPPVTVIPSNPWEMDGKRSLAELGSEHSEEVSRWRETMNERALCR